MRNWKQQWFPACLVVIAVLALILRILNLDARPVMYDEGAHALKTWEVLSTGEYHYNPHFHGPLLYFISSPAFAVFGESVLVGRSLNVAISMGMFGALYLLRDELPRPALLGAGVLLAVHPTMLKSIRYWKNDTMASTFVLLTIAAYLIYRQNPTRKAAMFFGGVFALAIASKEVAYILLAGAFAPIILAGHFERRYAGLSLQETIKTHLPTQNIAVIVLTAGVILAFLFGGWPPNPLRAPVNMVYSLEVWLVKGQDGDANAFYYLKPLITGATAVFAFSLLGCLGTLLRREASLARWMFVGWAAFGGLIMSLVGHQWIWLFINISTPVLILAGLGVYDTIAFGTDVFGRYFDHDSDTRRAALFSLAILVLAVTSLTTPAVGVVGITEPGHPDHTKQTFEEAINLSETTGCDIIYHQTSGRFPQIFYLRYVEYNRTDALPSDTQSIIISREDLDRTRTYISPDESWKIYRDGC